MSMRTSIAPSWTVNAIVANGKVTALYFLPVAVESAAASFA
jgi:hypothetical protein